MKPKVSGGGKPGAAGRAKERARSKPDKVFGEETASLTPELQRRIRKAGRSDAGNVRAQRDGTRLPSHIRSAALPAASATPANSCPGISG